MTLPANNNNLAYTMSDLESVVQLLENKGSPVWLTCDDKVTVRKTSRGKLGGGAMKTAYGLEDDQRVVLLSSFEYLDRMIREEMSGAAFIRSLDVPTVELEKCHLSLANSDESSKVPVLMSRDFKSYAANSTFVIDKKNPASGTDLPSNLDVLMFGSRENALNASNWISVLDPGIKDLQKLDKNGFEVDRIDQLNLVLNGPNGLFNRNSQNWEFRPFIFDLTSKNWESEYFVKPELIWMNPYRICDEFIRHAIWDVVSPGTPGLNTEGKVLFNELQALVREMYPSHSSDSSNSELKNAEDNTGAADIKLPGNSSRITLSFALIASLALVSFIL